MSVTVDTSANFEDFDIDSFDPASFDAPVKTSAPESAELQRKIEAEVIELQKLWGQDPTQCGRVQGDILRGCTRLEDLLQKLPIETRDSSVELREAHNYMAACLIALDDMPAPVQKPTTPPAPTTMTTMTTTRKPTTVAEAISNEFHVTDVEKDGNCCIRAALEVAGIPVTPAVLHQVRGDTVALMKSEMYKEIDEQWDIVCSGKALLVSSLVGDISTPAKAKETVDAYCENMARNGTWFGHQELMFLPRATGVNFQVVDPAKTGLKDGKLVHDKEHMYFGGAKGSALGYLLHNGNHYLALNSKAAAAPAA